MATSTILMPLPSRVHYPEQQRLFNYILMKEIKLNIARKTKNSHLKLVALVDDEDYEYLNQFKWHAVKIHNVYYAKRAIRINGKTKMIRMHREIMKAEKGEIIDHKDMNGLNNQKSSNLRKATHGQNNANRKSKPGSTSKYLGVSYCKIYQIKKGKRYTYWKWIAQISINNKNKRIGRFNTEIEAALAYNKKAIEIHGEFANLNIINVSPLDECQEPEIQDTQKQ